MGVGIGFFRLSAGFADNCDAGVPHAQNVVVERGRRDARTTSLVESHFSELASYSSCARPENTPNGWA